MNPDPAPIELPLTPVRWMRDYRLGRSLVGQGSLMVFEGRLTLVGHRTSAIRSVLVQLTRLATVLVFLAGCGAVALTAVGMTWRTHAAHWLVWSLPGFLLVWVLSLVLSRLIRRLLEPRVTLDVAWSAVEAVKSDGWRLQLLLRHKQQPWWVRGRARRASAPCRALFCALRDAGLRDAALRDAGLHSRSLPPGAPAGGWPRPRPRVLDQLVVVAGVLALSTGIVYAGPTLLGALRGRPSTGPAAGVPQRMPTAQVEALTRACPPGPSDAPAVHNRRVGDDLRWSVEKGADMKAWSIIAARWIPGVESVPLADGEQALHDPRAVGLTLVVPRESAVSLRAALGQGDLVGTLCSGEVSRIDLATADPKPGPAIQLQRDGDDLVVKPSMDENTKGHWRLVVARQRDTGRLDWLDRCELPVWHDRVVLPLLPQADKRLRLPDFFGGSQDQARAVLVRRRDAHQVRARLGQRAVSQGAVPCADIDALAWMGLATASTSTQAPLPLLQERVTDLVRATPLFASGADHDTVVRAIHHRYRQVRHAAGADPGRHSRLSRADWRAVNAGFLDGLPWSAILGSLSMQYDVAQVERIRQRLSGDDPLGILGELFILRLAEELLDRVEPTRAQYNARIDVAEAWLDVSGGHRWVADGRKVRVPSDQVAAYYQVVGHFLLVDVARRIENQMSHDLAFRVTGFSLRSRLAAHGINLDIEKSTTRKALEAWVTGNFEYLGDRAVARLQEQITSQQSAINAASQAHYRLKGQWASGDGAARTATLSRDDHEIGWVALYDASRVRVGYHIINGKGTSRGSLGQGHTTLLATAGSYVTQDNKTAGLSAIDGHIDNFLISNKMDGLVIIDGSGRLTLLDMRHGGRLPNQRSIITPLERLADLHILLQWLEDHHASAFQTHLLGTEGDLAIDPEKASPTVRERRMLVQAAYKGNPIVAIVDLPGHPKVSLYEAAVIAIQALRTPLDSGGPGLDVLGVANLDVGSYNALESWSDEGRVLRQSWKPLGETMNLVTVVRR